MNCESVQFISLSLSLSLSLSDLKTSKLELSKARKNEKNVSIPHKQEQAYVEFL